MGTCQPCTHSPRQNVQLANARRASGCGLYLAPKGGVTTRGLLALTVETLDDFDGGNSKPHSTTTLGSPRWARLVSITSSDSVPTSVISSGATLASHRSCCHAATCAPSADEFGKFGLSPAGNQLAIHCSCCHAASCATSADEFGKLGISPAGKDRES